MHMTIKLTLYLKSVHNIESMIEFRNKYRKDFSFL